MTHAQADLGHRCPHMPEDNFARRAPYYIYDSVLKISQVEKQARVLSYKHSRLLFLSYLNKLISLRRLIWVYTVWSDLSLWITMVNTDCNVYSEELLQ